MTGSSVGTAGAMAITALSLAVCGFVMTARKSSIAIAAASGRPRRKTMACNISLTNSDQFAVCDDEDLDLVSGYVWQAVKDGANLWYAKTTVGIKPHQQTFSMHRLITGFPEKLVDHLDGN